MIRDSQGNLYGAGTEGGSEDKGVVYKIAPDGVENVLYNFTSVSGPVSARDAAGDLYGTSADGYGGGAVFKIDPGGNLTVLYSFTSGVKQQVPFLASLALGPAGNLFGTTQSGGSHNSGLVFELEEAAPN